MGGFAKIIAVILAIGVAGYRYYDHGSFSARVNSSASTTTSEAAQAAPAAQPGGIAPAAAAVAAQVSGPNQADAQYLQSYMVTVQRSDRSFPYGTTVQNLSLPSGHTAQLTIQKTKTGWCPIRHEDLYSVSMGVTVR